MTLQDLQDELNQCRSLDELSEFLSSNLHEIRPLFYGLTRGELQEQGRHIEYENTFYRFTNSPAGNALLAGEHPSEAIVALLVFFLSLFERAQLYPAIQAVTQLIPVSPLQLLGQALFEYKDIQDAANDYLARFDRILGLLQDAWNGSDQQSRYLCEDLLQEYILDAIIEPRIADIDLRPAIRDAFLNQLAQDRYRILRNPVIQEVIDTETDRLIRNRNATRSRIVEAFHAHACALAPEALTRVADEFIGEPVLQRQTYSRLPTFISDQLSGMGAVYHPQRQGARFNHDADDERNRVYLGTYFPKSVIESWNIVAELLAMPVIRRAFCQKDVIRLLDVGSGTGAAVVGTLLALSEAGRCEAPVEVLSVDTNEDALAKQGQILNVLKDHLRFELDVHFRQVNLPFDLEGFVPAFSDFAENENYKYDLITCWKCLCEFYNSNYATAQGIIRNALGIVSHMLGPYGICIIADVTTTDNGYEYFAMTLNREANEYGRTEDAVTETILPVPCARNATTCRMNSCYTQRRFELSHLLAHYDESKIAYRVLARTEFAHSITVSYTEHAAYRVNAARPAEACFAGRKREFAGNVPCGYTGFFAD